MGRRKKEPTLLGLEFALSAMPSEMQSAIKFAAAHECLILVGYVEEEKKVYLMTTEAPGD